jgi:hypothetical protein
MVVEVRQMDMVAKTSGAGESGPALSIGMFCKTELPAAPLQDSLVVPRHAIYDNEWVYVFVADGDAADGRYGRLERRRVPMLRSVRDEMLVDYHGREQTDPCELAPGDRVVVSPLSQPVVGMKLRLRGDELTAAPVTINTPGSMNPDHRSVPPQIAALASAGRNGGGR